MLGVPQEPAIKAKSEDFLMRVPIIWMIHAILSPKVGSTHDRNIKIVSAIHSLRHEVVLQRQQFFSRLILFHFDIKLPNCLSSAGELGCEFGDGCSFEIVMVVEDDGLHGVAVDGGKTGIEVSAEIVGEGFAFEGVFC